MQAVLGCCKISPFLPYVSCLGFLCIQRISAAKLHLAQRNASSGTGCLPCPGLSCAARRAQALFMFPILMLGCICVALCLAVLGARYTVRNLRRVWLRCDFAFSTFLLGQHAPALAQDAAPDPAHPGFGEP